MMNSLLVGLRQLSLRSSASLSHLSAPVTGLLANDAALRQQVQQRRHRGSTIQKIKGKPRPPNPFKLQPEPHKYNYIPILPEDGVYTTKALPIHRLAGRDPITGHVIVGTLGGGNLKRFRWIDYHRSAPDGGKVEEKVYSVRYDPLNTFLIALVAREGHKRWIVAAEHTKPGDIIATHNIIPKVPIVGKEGDSYPVGALVPGSTVHHVEIVPGQGATRCLVAGSHATIVRRVGSKIILLMPSKQEIGIDEHCYVTVGKTSNTNHYTVNLLCPQRYRWKGKRSHSGLFKKKDGYCGFKNRPPKPLKFYDTIPEQPKQEITQPIFNLSS